MTPERLRAGAAHYSGTRAHDPNGHNAWRLHVLRHTLRARWPSRRSFGKHTDAGAFLTCNGKCFLFYVSELKRKPMTPGRVTAQCVRVDDHGTDTMPCVFVVLRLQI